MTLQNNLYKGSIVNKGRFILDKKIEAIDEFWDIINTKKSIFARHMIYPSAFFFNWPIKVVNQWLKQGYFWTAEPK